MAKPIEADAYELVIFEARAKEIAGELLTYGQGKHDDERREFMFGMILAALSMAVTTGIDEKGINNVISTYFTFFKQQHERLKH